MQSEFEVTTIPGHRAPQSIKDRNPMLDASRLIAALAILQMHTFESAHLPKLGEAGRLGVPFFTVAAVFLLVGSLRKKPDRPFMTYLLQRFYRLYVPFLGWAAISESAMFLKHKYVSRSPQPPFSPGDLLTGRSFQLWFLPFIFFVGIAVFPICRWAVQRTRSTQWIIAVLAIFFGLAVAYLPMPFEKAAAASSASYFFSLSWNAVSPVFLGFAMGLILPSPTRPDWQAIAGLVFTVAAMAYVLAFGRNILIESLAGISFMFFALAAWKNPAISLIAKYPFLVYGIYLAQGVVLEAMQTAMTRAHLRPTIPLELAVFAVSAAICIASSFVLNRFASTRWLLG
jgi:hypothetical protein